MPITVHTFLALSCEMNYLKIPFGNVIGSCLGASFLNTHFLIQNFSWEIHYLKKYLETLMTVAWKKALLTHTFHIQAQSLTLSPMPITFLNTHLLYSGTISCEANSLKRPFVKVNSSCLEAIFQIFQVLSLRPVLSG